MASWISSRLISVETPATSILLLLHLLLQYITCSRSRSHFLRQVKGRLQTGQILDGRFFFDISFNNHKYVTTRYRKQVAWNTNQLWSVRWIWRRGRSHAWTIGKGIDLTWCGQARTKRGLILPDVDKPEPKLFYWFSAQKWLNWKFKVLTCWRKKKISYNRDILEGIANNWINRFHLAYRKMMNFEMYVILKMYAFLKMFAFPTFHFFRMHFSFRSKR